eukprot:GEZU01021271.1.p1 GENE.GEZU01021271.1~~GEZU01021271.1.p1  ORF type:complete len:116 (-),score=5.36 GEZU01021271.1:100-447(-)
MEMNRHAYLASSVHLLGLAIEFWNLNLGRRGRISYWDIELQIELVLDHVMNVPALAKPPRSIFVAFYLEPRVVILFVDFHVLDECCVFLFQPLHPVLSISWPSLRMSIWVEHSCY